MSDRDPDGYSCSNRSLLANALIEDTKNEAERIFLTEYHAIIKQMNDDERMRYQLNQLYRKNQLTKDTEALLDSVLNRTNANDKRLIELEQTQPLRDVLVRERDKYNQRMKLESQRFYENQVKERDARVDEILQKYERDRQQAIEARKRNEVAKFTNVLRQCIEKSYNTLHAQPKLNATNEIKTEKPNIFKAIGAAILSIICFYMIYAIVFLIIGLIFLILDKIPIISNIVKWMFFDTSIEFISILAAYHITKIIVCVLNKNAKTRVLSFAIIGVYLIVFNALCLILNIIYGGNFLLNILIIISGFIYFCKRQDYVEE